MRCLVRDGQRDYLCLKSEGFEDLLQECLIHWFFMKDKYRPEAGAIERTFLNRVIRHKLSDIARLKHTNKRKAYFMSESLDVDIGEENDETKEALLMVDEQVAETITAADLPAVIAKAIANLSFRQKQLCRCLMEGMSIAKAGEKMSIPRTTLNEEVKRIRDVFLKEGLEEYLW